MQQQFDININIKNSNFDILSHNCAQIIIVSNMMIQLILTFKHNIITLIIEMGPALSQNNAHPNLHQLFPKLAQYKLQSQSQSHSDTYSNMPTYIHIQSNRIAQIRSFQLYSAKPSIQSYYTTRRNIKKCPYIFQLIDLKITPSIANNNKNNVKQSFSQKLDNNLCRGNNGIIRNNNNKQEIQDRKTMWMLVQSSHIWLEDQIINRVDKKCFEEIQLWSVLSNCVLGATALLENGFKQPVLSPKGIGLSKDGSIQVGEWQLISKINYDNFKQQGQVLFGKLGQPISQSNKNSLNEILLNYYWAPQGLRAMQNFISLGCKQAINSQRNPSFRANTNKFQIFSLGMTLISMCLRNFYYRTDTFSEKYLQKLTHQAFEIRKIQGKQLSHQIKSIIQSMVKWDPCERISYSQLKDRIVSYFSQHTQQMKNSEVSLKTFNQSDNLKSFKTGSIRSRSESQTDNLSMNLTSVQNSFTDGPSMNFGHGEAQYLHEKHNKKGTKSVNQCSHHGISTTSSAFDGYEGSGLVEQGTGDQDDNLKDQGEQINYENKYQGALKSIKRKTTSSPNNVASPCTHNKQQLKPCPPCTPISAHSPQVVNNSSKRKMENSPYLNNQQVAKISQKDSGKDQRRDSFSKSNQVYLKEPEEIIPAPLKQRQQISVNNVRNMNLQIKTAILNSDSYRIEPMISSSTSNRGSYRSSNKQPPLLRSARPNLLQNQRYLNYTESIEPTRTYQFLPPIQRQSQKQKQYDYSMPSFKLDSNKNPTNWTKSISFKQDINTPPLQYTQQQYTQQYTQQYNQYRKQHTKYLQQDQQDEINVIVQYRIFRNSGDQYEQITHPDIFQKMDDQPSSILSIGQSRHSLQQSLNINNNDNNSISNIEQYARNTKPAIALVIDNKQRQKWNLKNQVYIDNSSQYLEQNQTQNNNVKDRVKRYSENEQQYMTFNQKQRSSPTPLQFQDSFHQIQLQYKPSKWNKPKQIKRQTSPAINKQQQQSLFTDPKLLQYIRSPIRSSQSITQSLPYFSSKASSSLSSFNVNNNPARSINLQSPIDNYNASSPLSQSTQHRNNQQNIIRSKQDSKQNRIVLANSSNNNNNQQFTLDKSHNSNNTKSNTTQNGKIVREKVAKGFYEGQKKNGMRSGYGVFYYNQGGKYKGNWLNNMMHGKGTLQYADGRIAYQGQWHNDQLHGKGVLYNQSPNFVTTGLNYEDLDQLDQCWVFYQGTFNHDDKDGMGLLVLSNQEQFIGEFKNDLAQGVGQYLKNDGTVIKGIWSKNKLKKIIQQS